MNWWIVSLAAIFIFAFWPLIAFLVAMLFEIEEPSVWAAVPWYLFFTVPAGLVLFLIWLGAVAYAMYG